MLTAGSGHGENAFGLSSALASAMRKVVDALPPGHQVSLSGATARFLVEPETDLLSRRLVTEIVDAEVMRRVRQAVLTGRKLRFEYAAPDREPRRHEVDPLGLVTVRDRTYLLALKKGEDRTYRLSRITTAEVLDEAAKRPESVDLDQMWADRTAAFLSEDHIPVLVRVKSSRREELLEMARAARAEEPDADGWVRMDVSFEDLRHALWALWQLDTDTEALAPASLRRAIRQRATTLLERYHDC